MKPSFQSVLMSSLLGLTATLVSAAEAPAPTAVPPATVKPVDAAVVPPPSSGGKAVATGSTVGNKSGDNMYPGLAVLPPKPPKKEALEGAKAIKGKAAQ